MALATRPLGRTGAEVTVLGFGAMELRGAPTGPQIADEDAGSLLNAVLDSGVNFIDTSIDYGRSEELIGRFIGHRRDEYFLASKCGCPTGEFPPGTPRPLPHDFSPANVRAGVEQSLRRLGTETLGPPTRRTGRDRWDSAPASAGTGGPLPASTPSSMGWTAWPSC